MGVQVTTLIVLSFWKSGDWLYMSLMAFRIRNMQRSKSGQVALFQASALQINLLRRVEEQCRDHETQNSNLLCNEIWITIADRGLSFACVLDHPRKAHTIRNLMERRRGLKKS